MPHQDSTTGGPVGFQTTHWSLVLAAGQPDSPQAQAALSQLCHTYWYPVYAFLRRRGQKPDEAKDLTQELFHRLIEKRSIEVVDREKGRFRSFLLACVQNLLAKQREKEHTLKRGGQYSFVPLDEAWAESRYSAEPADPMSPENLFERRWALTLLDQAMEQLQREYANAGKSAQFEALQVFLSGAKDSPASYAEVGAQLNVGENATRQAAYRMRGRFGELLRMQVAQTVASPAELDAELRHLRKVLSG